MESPAGCMESVAKRRHGITRQRVFLLRIDYIQHFVLIPYRRQAADFIHAYRRDYIESYVEVLDFQGLFRFFRAVFLTFLFLQPFPNHRDLNLRHFAHLKENRFFDII